VLAAPSGGGKSSVTRALLESEPELMLSVSATTRPPRPGEREGEHYFFRDETTFAGMVAAGELLEWATVFGRRYGTPRAPVETALAAGRDVVFDIDWQGHRQLRAALSGDVVGIFLMPPSLIDLESRLLSRAADSSAEIARRMAEARAEIAHWAEFDYTIVNQSFDQAVRDVRTVLHAARLATGRQTFLSDFVETLTGNS
jgi:guanylate kinase